ncbi:MAG: manganese efflux pump family protein [Campylobacterota bacterium]|nr:manganese efflux pump family protein [Campylobacterota bacterium]
MVEVLFLAFALSMDAFAVSVGIGVKNISFNRLLAVKAGVYFGLFQGFMPLFGYLASIGLGSFIESVDHWIAFVLLILIGGKMIYESFGEKVEEEFTAFTNKVLLLLAIATSIDALAAGFTLGLLGLNPFVSMVLIGIITFVLSYAGVFLGTKGGSFLEEKAEVLGGMVLMGIGVKILLEHILCS